MHERWQDLIPFYVAGSLSAAEAADLERHLDTCAACRQTLDEWRIIGRVVRAEGEMWSQRIPPLSPATRAGLQAAASPSADGKQTWPEETQLYPRAAARRYPAQRRTWGALTLAAAFAMLILVGGLALYMAGRPETAGDEDATNVALLASVTQTQGGEPIFSGEGNERYGAPGGLSEDMGILPAGTPSPGTSTTGGQAQLPPNATRSIPGPTQTRAVEDVLTQGRCEAGSGTGRAVAIYGGPGMDYELSGTMFPDEFLEVWQKNGAGWYMVVGQDGYIAGWVSEAQVTLYGPCENVPLPSPTYTSTPLPPGCYVTSTIHDSVNMRAGPGEQFEAINAFSRNDTAEVLARSDNHWYRVALPLYGNVWIGWVLESQVVLSGQCDALSVLSAEGYTPESTPMLATPTAVFGSIMGTGGYNLMTTQTVGSIPANTRVMVSYARYTGQEWVYFVVTQDGQVGVEVYEWQLTYAPDVTPNAPTPVARFSSEIGMGQYNVLTTAPIGNIPANTRVRVSTARFDGREWVYNVVAQDTQLAADALEWQLAYAPDATPGAPTPTATLSN